MESKEQQQSKKLVDILSFLRDEMLYVSDEPGLSYDFAQEYIKSNKMGCDKEACLT